MATEDYDPVALIEQALGINQKIPCDCNAPLGRPLTVCSGTCPPGRVGDLLMRARKLLLGRVDYSDTPESVMLRDLLENLRTAGKLLHALNSSEMEDGKHAMSMMTSNFDQVFIDLVNVMMHKGIPVAPPVEDKAERVELAKRFIQGIKEDGLDALLEKLEDYCYIVPLDELRAIVAEREEIAI